MIFANIQEDMKMRVIRFNFLFVIGLIVTLGLTTAFATGIDKNDKKGRQPKDTGTLTVRTTPAPYAVKIDGVYRGMSGINDPAEFYLTPGIHTVEVAGPNGTAFTKEIEIRRGAKHCICLKLVEETMSRACPYRFHLEGPDRIQEGDLVTFAAINSGTAPIPIRYAWRVGPGAARVTSGLGSPSITVDSAGLGGQTINAELDVNDDVYDNRCKQVISVPTLVTKIPDVVPPKAFKCDEFESKSNDDDKARLDNCVIQVQNIPDAQMYVIIYPGTDRISMTRNSYDRVSKRALDYITKVRGFDPRHVSIVKGGNYARTTYEIWVVPPGAQPPVAK